MPTEVHLPALSPTMTEGTLAEWRVAEGDSVQNGQVIADIETDKSVLELESPAEGIILSLDVLTGEEGIAVGTRIATIGSAHETPGADASDSSSSDAVDPRASAESTDKDRERIKSSPSARLLAATHDIDIATVTGTGPDGRITKRDVQQVVDQGNPIAELPHRSSKADPETSEPQTPSESRPQPLPTTREETPTDSSLSPRHDKADTKASYTDAPLSGMRKSIARTLQLSKQTIPHFCLEVEADLSQLLTIRRVMNEKASDSKLSLNDFVVAACARSLRAHPCINVALVNDRLRSFRSVDISIAVAVENGLLTPVIREADKLSIFELSTEAKNAAQRARDGRLLPEDYQGGSMTVSNLGATGVESFYAVINPPQASILAVGACDLRPVVRDGAIVASHMMTLSLSCDHRIIDGQPGGDFLMHIKMLLENPVLLLEQNRERPTPSCSS